MSQITIPSYYTSLTAHLPAFTAWLQSTHRVILPDSNEWTVLRYKSAEGLPNSQGTIHRNKRGVLTFNSVAEGDWLDWRSLQSRQGDTPAPPNPKMQRLAALCKRLADNQGSIFDLSEAKTLAQQLLAEPNK